MQIAIAAMKSPVRRERSTVCTRRQVISSPTPATNAVPTQSARSVTFAGMNSAAIFLRFSTALRQRIQPNGIAMARKTKPARIARTGGICAGNNWIQLSFATRIENATNAVVCTSTATKYLRRGGNARDSISFIDLIADQGITRPKATTWAQPIGLTHRRSSVLHHARDVDHEVVVEHDDHQRGQNCEAELLDPFLRLEREVAAEEALHEQDGDVTAVEHRNRQQVHHAELKRDHRHQRDQGDQATAQHLAGDE